MTVLNSFAEMAPSIAVAVTGSAAPSRPLSLGCCSRGAPRWPRCCGSHACVRRTYALRRTGSSELLHIDLDQRSGMFVLTVANRFAGADVDVMKTVQPATSQHDMNSNDLANQFQ